MIICLDEVSLAVQLFAYLRYHCSTLDSIVDSAICNYECSQEACDTASDYC